MLIEVLLPVYSGCRYSNSSPESGLISFFFAFVSLLISHRLYVHRLTTFQGSLMYVSTNLTSVPHIQVETDFTLALVLTLNVSDLSTSTVASISS